MESNNIVSAPEIIGCKKLYEIWSQNHLGNIDTFYEFITTPSVEREEFINSIGNLNYVFDNSVAEIVLGNSK